MNEVAVKAENQQVTEKLLMDYLKAQCLGLTQQQVDQFVAIALAFNLNPWKKEIYAVPYNTKEGKKLSIVTGYEVYVKRADLNPNYDGFVTEWKGDFELKTIQNKYGYNTTILAPKGVVSCTCIVHRKDRKCPTRCEVFFDEYDQHNSMWQTKPRVMLEKVAIARALRLAFPNDFGGMPYASEELPEKMGVNLNEQKCVNDPGKKPENVQEAEGEVVGTVVGEAENEKHVEQPPAISNEEDKEAQVKIVFVKMMDDIKKINPEVYTDELGKQGYEAAAEVPKANRQKVYKAVKKAVEEAAKVVENV